MNCPLCLYYLLNEALEFPGDLILDATGAEVSQAEIVVHYAQRVCILGAAAGVHNFVTCRCEMTRCTEIKEREHRETRCPALQSMSPPLYAERNFVNTFCSLATKMTS